MKDIKAFLKTLYICKKSNHQPNAATKKACKNADAGKNLTKFKNLKDFFRKMGI